MSDGVFKDYSGKDGKPTKAEAALIKACREGGTADCAVFEESERLVSAKLIAALATESFEGSSKTTKGLRVVDATIVGRIDLEGAHVVAGIYLRRCAVPGGFDFDGAHFAGNLFLRSCFFKSECRMMSAVIQGQVMT